jgi:hypothetical protein
VIQKPHISILILALAAAATFAQKERHQGEFLYDRGDVQITGSPIGANQKHTYQPAVAVDGDVTWIAWLDYAAPDGDAIRLAQWENQKPQNIQTVTKTRGEYSTPTLTVAENGKLWLTFEAAADGDWELFATSIRDGKIGEIQRLTRQGGPDVHHAVTADQNGNAWIAWQRGADGQFRIEMAKLTDRGLADVRTVSTGPANHWHPSVAAAPNGETVFVVWDTYAAGNYDVALRVFKNGKANEPIAVTTDPAFEARAQVACDTQGRAWIAWERGGTNWGMEYRPKLDPTVNMADDLGALHRFREIHLAMFDGNTVREVAEPLPMPAIETARSRDDRPTGVHQLGAFYERPELCIDGSGRVWVAYRHYYTPWLGMRKVTHVQGGWGVYARHLAGEGWSPLYQLDQQQGDGLERVSLAATQDGLMTAWTVGRTDRRKPTADRGVHVGRLTATDSPDWTGTFTEPKIAKRANAPKRQAHPLHEVKVADETFRLYFGDLHRHTDLSLCFVPSDGTIDDAYRYAIDAGQLDFLGITDHARDISNGDVQSLLWWRSSKEVDRHFLTDRFVPLVAFERSHQDTDHNVVSLRRDILKPHNYPLPTFWEQIDRDTFTIPHQPFIGKVWAYHDEQKRPLAEVYQGFRDTWGEEAVLAGLKEGYRFGFISSSDHLSTSASFAAVYSPGRDRESIFRSMQSRRTYAATAKIVLDVRAGNHWMGETIDVKNFKGITVRVRGTGPIAAIRLYSDGRLQQTWEPGGREAQVEWSPGQVESGEHYYYFRVEQADGHQAWSSPIWVR